MRKSLLLLSTLILLKAAGIYGQENKEEARWKCAFAGDCSAKKTGSPSPTGTYLVELPEQSSPEIFKAEKLTIKRRLSSRFYIIQAPANWVTANKSSLTYLAPVNNNWKLSPSLLVDTLLRNAPQKNIFHISVSDTAAFMLLLKTYSASIRLLSFLPSIKTFRVETDYPFIAQQLLNSDEVVYIEQGNRRAKVETPVADFNNAVNSVNLVHAEFPALTGEGLTVSVKEEQFDSADLDITGRALFSNIGSDNISQHATTMATIIAGAGNSYFTGLGSAPAARLNSADFLVLLPDNAAYTQYGISVQNHSYGVAIENFYGSDASAYDASMIDHPSLLHVFSSGNSGNEASAEGRYKDITGFANLTGSFKMAKNIICVGAMDQSGSVAELSSRGPAYDGRLKPELLAYGQGGSSEAAAMVSGIALLAQNAYTLQHLGALPANALLKAILLNSADDTGNKGIDFSSGYGNANAYRAIQNIQAGHYISGSISGDEEKTAALTVPANAVNLKIMLVWNDPPAQPNAFKSLVNDIDLEVTHNTQLWLPWVLNSFPHPDSLEQLPVRKKDTLNVVEQVTIDSPVAGSYTIHIKAGSITGIQPYYIAYQWDTLQHFKWSFPAATDNLFAAADNTLRWNSTYPNQKALLEYRFTTDAGWQSIDSVDLSLGRYIWNTPDTFALALLRMRVDNAVYTSDTFSISSTLPLQVGFNCDDSLALYWNAVPGITQYAVYHMGTTYLEQVRLVADTSIIWQKTAGGSAYFAIAPLLSATREGVKSNSINSGFQGVECYIRNFLADLQPDQSALLTLNLSSSYAVERLSFEKQQVSGWVTLQVIPVNSSNVYSVTDNQLIAGVNNYRVKIEFTGGAFIYTSVASLYFLADKEFIVFPNPVYRNQPLYILSKDAFDHTAILYDIQGRKLRQQKITTSLEPLQLTGLSTGMYILVVEHEGKRVMTKKVIIR